MTDQEQELQIKIDLENMTFGDLEQAMKWQGGQVPAADLIPMLNRIVVGGVRHLPIRAMPQIMEAVSATIKDQANPN